MNEADLMKILRHIYGACQIIDTLKDDIDDEEVYDFLIDIYDELFEYTNIIEEFFGLLNE